MFEVEFYDTSEGLCPVQEFLDSLEPKIKAKTLRTIDLLETNGPKLREPYSAPMGDGIFERFESSHGAPFVDGQQVKYSELFIYTLGTYLTEFTAPRAMPKSGALRICSAFDAVVKNTPRESTNNDIRYRGTIPAVTLSISEAYHGKHPYPVFCPG